jgi:hypothetical protein
MPFVGLEGGLGCSPASCWQRLLVVVMVVKVFVNAVGTMAATVINVRVGTVIPKVVVFLDYLLIQGLRWLFFMLSLIVNCCERY